MMDFSTISSIKNYVKKLDSKFQAEQRSEGKTEKKSNLDEWRKQQEEKAKSALKTLKDMEENTDHKLAGIQSKVYSGASLSREEREYLKTKNPVLYSRLEAADLEKKAYERELKRCRTKDEVQRLKLSHTASSLSAVNAGNHSSVIPTAQKMSIAQGELYKMKGIQDITNKFVRSGAYHRLPTEYEKTIAEKRVKQAEERRYREIAQGLLDEIYGNKYKRTDEEVQNPEEFLPTEAMKDNIDPKKFTDIKPEETVEQAENSPEMLKFKRAKARRGYNASETESFIRMINQKN